MIFQVYAYRMFILSTIEWQPHPTCPPNLPNSPVIRCTVPHHPIPRLAGCNCNSSPLVTSYFYVEAAEWVEMFRSRWVFSSTFAAYFQNTFSKEHLWVAASGCLIHGCYTFNQLCKNIKNNQLFPKIAHLINIF